MTPSNEVFLPLFPAASALLPQGNIRLTASESSHRQLLLDHVEAGRSFAVVHYDESGHADVGCTTFADRLEEHDGTITCSADGFDRFFIRELVSFEGEHQRVISGSSEVLRPHEGLALPYRFVRGELIADASTASQEDIRGDLRAALMAAYGEDKFEAVQDVFDNNLKGEPSFLLASIVVRDDTPPGNALRLSLMRQRSETERLRMLRDGMLRDGVLRDEIKDLWNGEWPEYNFWWLQD